MGPLFVLVLWENIIVTCKIVSFLCSLDNFLLKNVIISFLEIKFQNGAHLKKGGYFDLLFTRFSHQGKRHKNCFSTYLTYIHTRILLTLLTFFALPILQKLRIYRVWFLFGVSPVLIPFRAILKQSINKKMVSKI